MIGWTLNPIEVGAGPVDDHPNQLERAFGLGMRLAEHVHGIRRGPDPSQDKTEAILTTLEEIASGDFALIDTPEVTAAELPPGMPESFRKRLPGMLNESRRQEREMAALILRSMFGDPSTPEP
jgi:hypothetical protein